MIAKMKAVDAQVKLTTKGQGTGWSTEITAWRLELAAAKLVQEFNDTAIVGHFETKLRSLQASTDRAKAQAAKTGAKTFNFQDGGGYKALAVRKYDKPCSWCFEHRVHSKVKTHMLWRDQWQCSGCKNLTLKCRRCDQGTSPPAPPAPR